MNLLQRLSDDKFSSERFENYCNDRVEIDAKEDGEFIDEYIRHKALQREKTREKSLYDLLSAQDRRYAQLTNARSAMSISDENMPDSLHPVET